MTQKNLSERERRDEMMIWKSLLAAGIITLIFYIFVLAYTG